MTEIKPEESRNRPWASMTASRGIIWSGSPAGDKETATSAGGSCARSLVRDAIDFHLAVHDHAGDHAGARGRVLAEKFPEN